MKYIKKKFEKVGKYETMITFETQGEEKGWVGILDARNPGEYELIVVANHKVPRTKGRVLVKAVVGEGAKVRIKGVIRIAKLAQETDDFLELRVLCLSAKSFATADPELEIEANNVKASHAASIGMIDSDQLLYLQSRGLSRELAQAQIVEGWLEV